VLTLLNALDRTDFQAATTGLAAGQPGQRYSDAQLRLCLVFLSACGVLRISHINDQPVESWGTPLGTARRPDGDTVDQYLNTIIQRDEKNDEAPMPPTLPGQVRPGGLIETAQLNSLLGWAQAGLLTDRLPHSQAVLRQRRMGCRTAAVAGTEQDIQPLTWVKATAPNRRLLSAVPLTEFVPLEGEITVGKSERKTCVVRVADTQVTFPELGQRRVVVLETAAGTRLGNTTASHPRRTPLGDEQAMTTVGILNAMRFQQRVENGFKVDKHEMDSDALPTQSASGASDGTL
jgi:hypothetical protein